MYCKGELTVVLKSRMIFWVISLSVSIFIVWAQPARSADSAKSTSPKASTKEQKQVISNSKQKTRQMKDSTPGLKSGDLPLAISHISMIKGTIHVTIVNNGKGKLAASSYGMVRLKLFSKDLKAPAQWNLVRVDPKKRLRRNGGRVVFDTGLHLKHPRSVRAVLIKGSWNTEARVTLSPSTAVKGKKIEPTTVKSDRQISHGKTMPPASRSIVKQRLGMKTDTRALYWDGGISVEMPGEGDVFQSRDTITIRYAVTADVEAGPIRFWLIKAGNALDSITQEHVLNEEGELHTAHKMFQWRLPFTSTSSDNYIIFADHIDSDAHGMSHNFTIQGSMDRTVRSADAIGPVITFRDNWADEAFVLDTDVVIRWDMPDPSEADCGGWVDLYAVRLSNNHETRIHGLATTTGMNAHTWRVDSSRYSTGRYSLRIVSSTGCSVRSPAFDISGCDYALESVTFNNGRPLSDGVDASSGREITGTFKVAVRWNQLAMAPVFDPTVEINNLLTVKSVRTEEVICVPEMGVNFNYGQARSDGLIFVEVPFTFLRAGIPDMRNSNRRIPLEFNINPLGISVDIHGSNNTMTADLRINNATESDFHLLMDPSGLTITERDARSGSTSYLYRISQVVHLSNLSRNDVGGSPAPVHEVPFMVYIHYRDSDGSGVLWHRVYRYRHYFPTVTGDSSSTVVSIDYSVPKSAPDRPYRIKVVVDPDEEYLDPTRSNNQSFFTYDHPH